MLASISWGTYIFFAAFCLLAFLFTYFCIPETRGKVGPCTLTFLIYLPPIPIFLAYTNRACKQTLEDMDLIFGDTAAHEEKQRIVQIESSLRGTGTIDDDVLKKPETQEVAV